MDKPIPGSGAPSSRAPLIWTLAALVVIRPGDKGGLPTDAIPGLTVLNESREQITTANRKWAGGNKAEAAPFAEKAVALAQQTLDNPDAHVTIKLWAQVVQGQGYRILGDNAKAMQILEAVIQQAEALKENGLLTAGRTEWSYAAAMAGRADEAIKLLKDTERMFEQGPNGHECRLAQARVYEITGQYGKAVQVYNIIADRYPGREREWKHRAEFLLAQLQDRMGAQTATQTFTGKTIAETLIRDAQVWTKEGGPYLVPKTLTIAAGGSLEIKAGATVKFAEGAGLVVHGLLTARGGAGEQEAIRLLPANERLAGYSWLGVEIAADGSQPTSVLEHCRIEKAAAGVHCRGGSPQVKNCSIAESGSVGIRVTSATGASAKPRIEDTAVTGSAAAGVELRGKGVEATLVGVVVENNDGMGVSIEDAASPALVRTTVRKNGAEGIVFARAGTGRIGEQTRIADNRGHGIRMDYRCTAVIEGATVTGNGGVGIYVFDSEPRIDKAAVESNAAGGVAFAYTASGRLTNCRILNNAVAGVVFENNPGRPEIKGNRIAGSPVGVLVREGADLTVSDNDLSGNKEHGLRNETGNVVDARGNFWGPAVEAEIGKLIKGPAKFDGFKSTGSRE
jgi:hypothetical protein